MQIQLYYTENLAPTLKHILKDPTFLVAIQATMKIFIVFLLVCLILESSSKPDGKENDDDKNGNNGDDDNGNDNDGNDDNGNDDGGDFPLLSTNFLYC